jgi:hypothetical protein
MFRSLRPHALLLSLAIAGAASGQTFQGLDSPQQPKKKPAKKSSSSSKSAPSKTPTATPASATTPATTAPAAAPAKATAPAQQDLGLDLSKPAPAQQAPAQPMPMPPPPSKKGTAPTTTFEALDVTGRTADRQRLEAAKSSPGARTRGSSASRWSGCSSSATRR